MARITGQDLVDKRKKVGEEVEQGVKEKVKVSFFEGPGIVHKLYTMMNTQITSKEHKPPKGDISSSKSIYHPSLTPLPHPPPSPTP